MRVAVAIGMLVIAAGGALALVGSIRLGIGRHGAAWWRPFQNALTPAHVQNLAVFTSGVVMIAAGAVLSVSPLVRHMRRRI